MEAECDPITDPEDFKMLDIVKYNKICDMHDHVMAYTTEIKGNNLTEDEIESVLVKNYG